MSDYKTEEDLEDIVDTLDWKAPLVVTKGQRTKDIKNKLAKNIDKAIANIERQMSDPKTAYSASLQLLSYYISFANLEMKEETHREEMKFRRHKNKIMEAQAQETDRERLGNKVGNTASVSRSKFRTTVDESKWS